jgi:antitoxin component of MazEF toxin-antitoxin module
LRDSNWILLIINRPTYLELMSLSTVRKTTAAGGSLQVTIPAIWVKHHKLVAGSPLNVFLNDDGSLTLKVEK